MTLKLIATEQQPLLKVTAMTCFLQDEKIPFDFVVDTRIASVWLADKMNSAGDCFALTDNSEVLYTMYDLVHYLERSAG